MMVMPDQVDDCGEFSLHSAIEACAKDLDDPVGGEPPQAEFAAALEEFMNGEVALEDEVAAILDLIDGIETGQFHLVAFLGGEFRPQEQRPLVEPRPDDLGTQPIGCGLERHHIIDSKKRVVILAIADLPIAIRQF